MEYVEIQSASIGTNIVDMLTIGTQTAKDVGSGLGVIIFRQK